MLDFSKLSNYPQHNIQISVSHTTKTYLIKRLLELICLNEIWGNMHGWYRRVFCNIALGITERYAILLNYLSPQFLLFLSLSVLHTIVPF